MSSANYGLANLGNTNKIFFDLDPNPIPFLNYKRYGSEERTLPSIDGGGNPISGRSYFFDFGSDISASAVDVHLVMVTPSGFSDILTKYLQRVPLILTFNNFVNTYEVVFKPGDLGLSIIQGTNLYAGTLKFCVLSQVT